MVKEGDWVPVPLEVREEDTDGEREEVWHWVVEREKVWEGEVVGVTPPPTPPRLPGEGVGGRDAEEVVEGVVEGQVEMEGVVLVEVVGVVVPVPPITSPTLPITPVPLTVAVMVRSATVGVGVMEEGPVAAPPTPPPLAVRVMEGEVEVEGVPPSPHTPRQLLAVWDEVCEVLCVTQAELDTVGE